MKEASVWLLIQKDVKCSLINVLFFLSFLPALDFPQARKPGLSGILTGVKLWLIYCISWKLGVDFINFFSWEEEVEMK